MAAFHGVGINFAIDSTIVGVNGLFQTRDHHFLMDKEEILDGGESVVSLAYNNPREEASFTYVSFQFATYILGNAPVSLPTIGRFVQVIDPRYARIRGYWWVDDIMVSNSNTTAIRVTVKLSRYGFNGLGVSFF